MNGIHDVGGMHGFGRVDPELNEPAFHEPWEGRVLGLMRTILYTRAWNIDMFRDSIERLPPHVYISASYYNRWLLGLTQSAVEKGLVELDELESGHALHPRRAVERAMRLNDVAAAYIRPPYDRPQTRKAHFKPGDKVRTINEHIQGHTRLPRYARDKVGTVESIHGFHVYPNSVVAGRGDDPQWLYTVAFHGRDLWGKDSDPSLTVSIEAFEPYLEAI